MVIYRQPTAKFIYAFSYNFNYEILNFCRAVKVKFGGGQFNFHEDAWRFNSVDIIEIIKGRYPDVIVHENILPDIARYKLEQQTLKLRVERAEELKKATDTDFVVNGIKGELYNYQRLGVEFLVNNNGRAMLFDQMGCGKSVQALGYVAHNKIAKTLVVCPASVKMVWFAEIKKWSKLRPYIIDAKIDLTLDVIGEYDIFISNYNILHKFLKILTSARIDCLIVDEVQMIKSISARRSKCVKLIGRNVPSIILLSGSPLLNRPSELFNGLNLIDPITWNDYYHFCRRYCDGHQGAWGFDASGASNIEELQKKISRYFLRRLKKNVLSELPPKTFVDVPMELESEDRKKYDYAENSFMEYLRDIKLKNSEEINRSLSAEKLTRLQELRSLTSNGKIETAKEIIENIIEGDEKVVVFSVYNEPLNKFKEYFGDKAVLLTGSTKEKDRNKAITDFQNKDDIKIFLGGTLSAGVGITLTAAANVLLLDYPWTNGDRDQSIDRIHRPGQKANHATIYQLIAKNTIDQKMQEILASKKEISDQLIDGKKVVKQGGASIVNELLKSFEK